MGCVRVVCGPGFRRVPATMAVVSAALLAGGGVASAAQHSPARTGGRGPAVSGTISTVAGGVGGPGLGTKVALNGPCGVAASTSNVYISSGGTVRQVRQNTGYLTTLAGTGAFGPLGTGGPAISASISSCGLAVDHSHNVVIADTANNLIRVAAHASGTFYGQSMTAGDIYTVAGGGTGGNGGLATSASLASPEAVAVDSNGNLLIADTSNNEIQVVAPHSGTFYGQSMTAGHIYDVAGDGTEGYGGDGGPATEAALDQPAGVAVDAAGNILIADAYNNRIRVLAESTGTFYGQAMTAGDIYTVAGDGTEGYGGDGGPATEAALQLPGDVTVDQAGNLVIADTANLRIRVLAESTGTFYGQAMTAGDIYTVAGTGKYGFNGNGIPATSAGMGLPSAVAIDHLGNLVIANTKQNRVQVVAVSNGTFYGQKMTAGDIYTVAGTLRVASSGDFGLATSAELDNPWGIDADTAGDLLISSYGDIVEVVPAATGTLFGQAMTAGHIYTVAGTGKVGFSGDGGPAAKAELGEPVGISTDAAGNLLIPDRMNNRIRVVPDVSGTYYGQAMTAGHIYTVAGDGTQGYTGDGGSATAAELNYPRSVTTDAAGNLVIDDDGNDVIRVVAASSGTFYGQAMTAGDIYTVAGDGGRGYAGDGGPATSAEMNNPDVAITDSSGNLVLCDNGNDVIRVVAASSGTFYGQAMTAGDIYTIVGDGVAGYAGDGGPATSAELDTPPGIAFYGKKLVIADKLSNRIREVTG